MVTVKLCKIFYACIFTVDMNGRQSSLRQRRYPYLSQLMALEAHTANEPVILPKAATEICTPLYNEKWVELPKLHPDREFTNYITQGIAQGFHIGFNLSMVKLRACKHNLLSASFNPQVVEEYLAEELVCGYIAGITLHRMQSNRYR